MLIAVDVCCGLAGSWQEVGTSLCLHSWDAFSLPMLVDSVLDGNGLGDSSRRQSPLPSVWRLCVAIKLVLFNLYRVRTLEVEDGVIAGMALLGAVSTLTPKRSIHVGSALGAAAGSFVFVHHCRHTRNGWSR